jgi:hypothetical protein
MMSNIFLVPKMGRLLQPWTYEIVYRLQIIE